MKVLLIFTLLILTSCNNYLEKASDFLTCILKKENVIEQFLNVIKSFKTKDFSTIISTIFSAYLTVKDDVMECLNTKSTLRFLQNCINQEMNQKCRSKCKGPMHLLCKKDCFNCWCL